jgi:hypothetical protein
VTSRLRELIQQLGEAIHESVVESEQIAGVVQDIRKHGFDVLLMLEATIGLNEVGLKRPETLRRAGSRAARRNRLRKTISTFCARCGFRSREMKRGPRRIRSRLAGPPASGLHGD